MAKQEGIKIEGTVIEVLPAATFKIKIPTTETPVMGYISGKMRTNDIRILLGDTVEMEFSPYDMSKGRITRRR